MTILVETYISILVKKKINDSSWPLKYIVSVNMAEVFVLGVF
jgi:hypothetical protein